MPQTIPEYDLTDSAFRADPFPTFAEMRRKAPIYPVDEESKVVWENGRVWYTLRYDHSLEVLLDPRRFVKDLKLAFDPDQVEAMPETHSLIRLLTESVISQEDPQHARLRKLVNQAFSPSMVQQRSGQIEAVIQELLDEQIGRGRMDLLNDFAFRVPVQVITSILGLPGEDADQLRAWTTGGGSSARTDEEFQDLLNRLEALCDYLRGHCEERRIEPRDDLITALLQAEIDGDRLTEEEIFAMVILLIGAGFETTMHTISNGFLNLMRRPEAMERLRADPSLHESAVEEFLRFEGPLFTATPRWAAEDVEFHGHHIRRGDRVFPMLLSANRDESQFPEADRFDVTRKRTRHLGLGYGVHFCLGGPLARLEARIALGALLQRLPPLRLAVAESDLVWIDAPLFHGVETLPVVWDPTDS